MRKNPQVRVAHVQVGNPDVAGIPGRQNLGTARSPRDVQHLKK